MSRFIFLTLCALALVGCSGVSHLGDVGAVAFYSVHAEHFTGPNFTSLVTETGATEADGKRVAGKIQIEKTAFGPGVGPSLIHGVSKIAADVGAATMYGHSLDFPDYEGDSTSIDNGSGSSSDQSQGQLQGQAQGQAQTAHGGQGGAGGKGGEGGQGGQGGGGKDCKPSRGHQGHGQDKDCKPGRGDDKDGHGDKDHGDKGDKGKGGRD